MRLIPLLFRARRAPEGPRTCLLHLGMNKTGTTVLQEAFRRYDDGRTRYLRLGPPNHSRALTLAYSTRVSRHLGARPGEGAALRQAFLAALDAAPGDVLISAEGLSHFPDAESVAALVADLTPRFARITALVYVREPGGYIASQFQQGLKTGLPQLDFARHWPRYRERLSRWTEALGQDAVAFAPYPPAGDIIDDFAARLGLDASRARRQKDRLNTSLAAPACAALLAHRLARGLPGEGVPEAANHRLVRRLMRLEGAPFALAPETLAALRAARAPDLAWAEARLGQPLASPPPRPGAASFADADALAASADAALPALTDWLRREFRLAATPASAVEALDLALARLG